MIARICAVLMVVALLSSCHGPQSPDKARPQVVTTTALLADLVREVAGDDVDVHAIVPPGADPHSYEPTMRSIRAIAHADAAFSNYLLLEQHSIIKTLDSTLPRGVPNVSIAEEATKYGAEVIPLVESGHLDALWLGLRVQGDAQDRRAEVSIRLIEAIGPGRVHGYISTSFGSPERFFDSGDSNGGRPITLPVNAHTHMSWAFSKPGHYSLVLGAFTSSGQEIARGNVQLAVGVPGEGETIDSGHVDLTVNISTNQFYAWADSKENKTQHSRSLENTWLVVPNSTLQEIPASNSYRFLGRPGELIYQLPQAVLGAHVHGEIDPHLWLNVANTKAYVRTITDVLVRIDPYNTQRYRQRESSYLQRLDQLDADIAQQLTKIPAAQRQLVTTHDAFSYLAHKYDLKVAGYISANSEVEASLSDRKRLLTTLRNLDVKAVFVQPLEKSSSPLHQVAAEAGVQVCTLYSDTLDSQVSSYIELMEFNASSLTQCLGGA